jgi:hypothetical protein
MNKIMYSLLVFSVIFAFSGCATNQNTKNTTVTINVEDFGEHFVEEQGGFEIYGPKG